MVDPAEFFEVAGFSAEGSPPTSDEKPVLVSGWDGTDKRTLRTDSSGKPLVLLYDANGVAITLGQKVMAASLPVVLASDQLTTATPLFSASGIVTRPLPFEPLTYSAASVAFVPPASAATDIFTLTGSATKTIRIHKIRISGTTTSGSPIKINVSLVKRSTANTGGTRVAVAVVPHDSNNVAATATVGHYTANPVLGTLIGAVRAVSVGITSQGLVGGDLEFHYDATSQPLILRGVNEQLAISLNGGSVTGPVFSIFAELSEVA